MANKKITDLMSGTPTRDSLFESAIDISGTMDSRKVTTGAIADLASANVAAAYNSATTYAIGQYCLYEGNIYRCTAITTGTFDATKWTQIVVTSEFRRVVELTTAQYEALSSAEQNNGTLYILTDGIPPSETITGSDIIPFIDVSDSNKPKSTTAAAVAGLAWDLTPTLITYQDSGNFETNDTQVIKFGKFVIISFAITTTSTKNSWTDILKFNGSFNSNITIQTALTGWDTSRYAQAYISNTNEVTVRIMGATANQSYRGQMIIPMDSIG